MTASSYEQLAALFGVEVAVEQARLYRPRYNIAPGDPFWIFLREENSRRLDPARWGLIPSWSKEKSGLINARSDTAATKPAFRKSFREKRCAIPADGFYEWTGDKKFRRPIWFHLPNNEIFRFAGLFEEGVDAKSQKTFRTFTILTADARGAVKGIHDRMPVILPPDLAEEWVSHRPAKTNSDVDQLQELLHSAPLPPLVATEVSRRVNSPRNDDPALLDPIQP